METAGTPEQITALYQSLIAAQAEFPPIPKTKQAYNYKYAPLSEIHEKIRPILIRHGLAVFHPLIRKDGKPAVGTTIIHKSGGRISCDGLPVPETLKIQEQGGHVTYGSRYGYSAMLGLTTEDEDETLLAQKSPRTRPPRPGGATQVVAQVPAARPGPSADSGSTPDPSLPTKQERLDYVNKLGLYRKQVTDDALQNFLLRESGAAEVRLIKKKDWLTILTQLDSALATGHLLEVVSANQQR
jgi:hypothetical protein